VDHRHPVDRIARMTRFDRILLTAIYAIAAGTLLSVLAQLLGIM
jgi:hypothetical protein